MLQQVKVSQACCKRAVIPAHCASSRTALRRVLVRASHDSAGDAPVLIVYTKPDCPLCDGLKEKVQALISRAQFMPCGLSGASLEVRDISEREDWQAAYAMQVPVVALATPSGEVVLPRPMPRISADRLQKHLEEAIAAVQEQQQQQ